MTATVRIVHAGLVLALLAGLSACASSSSRDFGTPEVIPAQTCGGNLDSDGDGVDECRDRCPGTLRGQAVDADGCPLPIPEEPKVYRG